MTEACRVSQGLDQAPFDLVSIGPALDADERAELARFVTRAFGRAARWRAPIDLPSRAYDARRDQHDSTALLHEVRARVAEGSWKVLAVTAVDICIPSLTFIFGRAELGGVIALLSVARLRDEFHGAPPNPDRFSARLRKEVLHELGHTFGLVHCDNAVCAMSFSKDVLAIDKKAERLCADCCFYLRGVLNTRARLEA